MLFEKYSEDDYEAVCDFLIELNRADRSHINWNWARFEWMYEHPEFDKGSLSSIGLWRDDKKIVGAAIYDMYFGEGFCGVLPGYESIYPKTLKYACCALKDEGGFSLAVCDDNPDEIKELQKQGFSAIDQSESIMELDMSREFMAKLPEGLSYYSPDPVKDAYKLEWLFWQGFDHGEDKKQFEKQEQIIPRVRKHYIRELGVSAIDDEGELVSFCGGWYSEKTDYVYIEPVCTIPAWRGKGVAPAVIHTMLNRARYMGANKASDGSLNDVGFDKDCSSWMDNWIIEAQKLAREDDPRKCYLAYVIEDKRTGSVVGSVGCSYYEDLEKVGVTYFIGADFRNNGYASEAIKAYVRYFFEHYDENGIIATIRENNLPSWKAIEKAGFSLTERKMYKDINDANEELYRFYSMHKS